MAPGPRASDSQLIVVADDDPSYLAMICELLADEGYPQVHSVLSTYADETIRRERPALALLDIHAASPAASWQMLKQLRHDPHTAAIPILICTTNPELVVAQAGNILDRGCQILEKPLDLDDLLAHVQRRIGPPRRPWPHGG